jgi:hypothetical protein
VSRHRFDPVSFVLGSLAVAAGLVVLAGGELTEEARVLLPAGLIALGAALLVRVARRDSRPAPEVPAVPAPPDVFEPSPPASAETGWGLDRDGDDRS